MVTMETVGNNLHLEAWLLMVNLDKQGRKRTKKLKIVVEFPCIRVLGREFHPCWRQTNEFFSIVTDLS